MDVLEAIGAVGGLIGSVGGLAGLFAYRDQRAERRRREATAHLPPELRPLLIDLVETLGQVERSPRSREWTEQHVEPQRARLEPLMAITGTADDLRRSNGRLTLLHATLHGVRSCAFDGALEKPPANIATDAVEQRRLATEGIATARGLLREMA